MPLLYDHWKLMIPEKSIPWYKEKLVWLIIAIPGTSIIMGIVIITLAVSGRDSLVKDEYYKEGRLINFELRKDQFAKHLGLQATLSIENQLITVALEGAEGFEVPALLKLSVIHPTLENADLNLILVYDGKFYTSTLPLMDEGRRYLQLTDAGSSWRLKGESWLPSPDAIILRPAVPERSVLWQQPQAEPRVNLTGSKTVVVSQRPQRSTSHNAKTCQVMSYHG